MDDDWQIVSIMLFGLTEALVIGALSDTDDSAITDTDGSAIT